jgi:hypothetical protein
MVYSLRSIPTELSTHLWQATSSYGRLSARAEDEFAKTGILNTLQAFGPIR